VLLIYGTYYIGLLHNAMWKQLTRFLHIP